MTGGNDYLNTVVPHSDPLYRDYRPSVGVLDEDVLRLDDQVGFHPAMAPIQKMYQDGDVAIIHGVGYENSPRSHFRSMDIWHTCEPDTLGTEGWLARVIRDIDPHKENVITAVSMGPALFRALVGPGIPVATVENIDSYGMLTGLTPEEKLSRVLSRYRRMYSPAIGTGPVMDYLGQTGLDALEGADILSAAPANYSSSIEYADTSVAKKLKGIAQIHLAGLGSRIFYLDHSGFDTHADQVVTHARLWEEVSTAIRDFSMTSNHTTRQITWSCSCSRSLDGGCTITVEELITALVGCALLLVKESKVDSTASIHRQDLVTLIREISFQQRISAAYTAPSLKTGWVSMPSPLSVETSRSLNSS